MLPDRVSNPGPLTYESGVLPIALRGPASLYVDHTFHRRVYEEIYQLFSISTPSCVVCRLVGCYFMPPKELQVAY